MVSFIEKPVDPEEFDNTLVEAIALVVGTMGGALKIPVHRSAPDDVLADLNKLFTPVKVIVKRGVWIAPAPQSIGRVGDALIFEHAGLVQS